MSKTSDKTSNTYLSPKNGGKIIFVNGYYNTGDGKLPKYLTKYTGNKAKEKYWSPSFIARAKEYFNVKNTSFVDGTGKWNSSGRERFQAGLNFARENYKKLTKGILDDKNKLVGELNIVAHSMGSAYSEGMIETFEEKGVLVNKVVHLSPADSNEFNASTNPFTIQLNMENDLVLHYKNFGKSEVINGVNMYGKIATPRNILKDFLKSHVDTKKNPLTFDWLEELQQITFHPLDREFKNKKLSQNPFKSDKKYNIFETNQESFKSKTKFRAVVNSKGRFIKLVGSNKYRGVNE